MDVSLECDIGVPRLSLSVKTVAESGCAFPEAEAAALAMLISLCCHHQPTDGYYMIFTSIGIQGVEWDECSQLEKCPLLLILGNIGHPHDPSRSDRQFLRVHCLFLMLNFNAGSPHCAFICLVVKFFNRIVNTFCSVAPLIVLSPNT